MACKSKSVRLFLDFFFHLPDRAFHLMEDLSSNCLSRNTFPNAFHQDKASSHFSELLLPLLRRIKEYKRMEYK